MTRQGRPRVPWWAWPSVLATGAPAVAVAWSWATADAAGASFTWRHACVAGPIAPGREARHLAADAALLLALLPLVTR